MLTACNNKVINQNIIKMEGNNYQKFYREKDFAFLLVITCCWYKQQHIMNNLLLVTWYVYIRQHKITITYATYAYIQINTCVHM